VAKVGLAGKTENEERVGTGCNGGDPYAACPLRRIRPPLGGENLRPLEFYDCER
jgi:hypothetical protein